jgi:hypothetical protein
MNFSNFRSEPVVDVLKGEGLGALVAIGGHIGAKLLDKKMGWTKPWKRIQEYEYAGAAVIGAYGVGTGKHRDMAAGLLIGDLVLVANQVLEPVFGTAKQVQGRVIQINGNTSGIRQLTSGQSRIAQDMNQFSSVGSNTLVI